MATQIDLSAGRWVMGGPPTAADTCGFCGRFGANDCAPVACMLCGTVQCHGNGLGNGQCRCCHYGFLPGWSHIGKDVCTRAKCDKPAVAIAARRPVCASHAAVAKIRVGSRTLTLAAYAAEHVAKRDAGTGHYLMRWRFVSAGGERRG